MNASLDPLIDALAEARRTRRRLPSTPHASRVRHADDAYLVQAALANEFDWFGDAPPKAWKSGAASRTATAGHSALPNAGVWTSPARLGDWPFALRGIEAEVALRLGRDVDAAVAATLTPESAHALVDAMAPAIELADSRWEEGFAAPALLKLADLQCHAALVLGAWVPYVRRDWSAQRCTVTLGDRPPEAFTGTHSCGDPAWLLPAWLQHATAQGQVVPAGTVVTTGTWCGLLTVAPGERVVVAFDGLGEAVLDA